ncbi:MAG: META domain-containing protein [Acidobacteria bacterium]|nr:META domain-containing protein [Acidobacteriota bacterium]
MNKWIALTFALTLAVWAPGCREWTQEEDSDIHPGTVDTAAPAIPTTETTMAAGKTPAPEDLLHRRFALAGVDGREFTIEDRNLRPDIEFNEGFQITGRVCNRYRGPAELKDGRLYAENLASTMMMCINSELNELEQLFFAMLRAGADISLTDGGMTLSQGGRVLSYARADWVR